MVHIYKLLALICCLVANKSHSLTYPYADELIGESILIHANGSEDLGEIGRRFGIGYLEMTEANPELPVDEEIALNTKVTIPSAFILPPGPKVGVVVNLAELRLYYYHEDGLYVTTQPVGIGRRNRNTPLGKTTIIEKRKDPIWIPTENIHRESLAMGEVLPKVVLAGGDNPLGKYALRLGWPEYSLHGTNDTSGVGKRSSAGCLRMFPEDIEKLYHLVKQGTKVRIINQPIKYTVTSGMLYLEVHAPLGEHEMQHPDWSHLVLQLDKLFGDTTIISWYAANLALSKQSGIPTPIGMLS